MKNVTVNLDQRLFVIPSGGGFTCLGFDVCHKWSAGLAAELGEPAPAIPVESLDAYHEYIRLCEVARIKHVETGWKSRIKLEPQLSGLEGKRVEVITKWDEKQRFIVGKSTGWMPCHLEIKRRDSHGGCGTCGPYKSVRVVS